MKETEQPDWLINAAPRIISHINEDHSNSIVFYSSCSASDQRSEGQDGSTRNKWALCSIQK